jgi:hypothetical protein
MTVSPGPEKTPGSSFLRTALITAGTLVVLMAAASPHFEAAAGPVVGELLRQLKEPGLSRRDAEQLQRGYYEQLTGVNRFNSRLWEVYSGAETLEDRRPLRDTDLVYLTNDFLWIALKPNLASTYRSKPFHTNRWAMRDRDYARTPPPGVLRIAVLGQSYVMGGAVADDETFEVLLEERLNRERRVEILNFGMGNYMPARQLHLLRQTVLKFEPDIVIAIGHQSDLSRLPSNIADALYAGAEIPFPFVRALLDSLGVTADTPHGEVMRRLMPYRERLYRGIQTEFVTACVERGATPLWIFIPTPEMTARDADLDTMLRISREAGFASYDLWDVYGQDARALWAAEWDAHPNAEGHRRIAERLYALLTADSQLLAR